MDTIAKRLKKLRLSRNLSQVKLAGLAETQQTTIVRYESGKYSPPVKLLLWYAEFFDVSLDYIFGRTDNPHGLYSECKSDSACVTNANRNDMEQFIEMCFDPTSEASAKIKELMLQMMEEKSK